MTVVVVPVRQAIDIAVRAISLAVLPPATIKASAGYYDDLPITVSDEERSSYLLGAGGRGPAPGVSPSEWRPWNTERRHDCSAYALWCCGMRRYTNTDGVLGDAWSIDLLTDKIRGPGPRERFEPWPHDVPVEPGAILVYGGRYTRIPNPAKPGRTMLKRTRPGHIAVVVDVLPRFRRGAPDWYLNLMAAHCSPRHDRAYGNAVAITTAVLWSNRGYLLRCKPTL